MQNQYTKSLVFLYINNENSEKKIRKTMIHNSLKNKIKYLGMNLTKEIKDLYIIICEILKKEIEENIR
jgi:hypothetical protein